MSNTAYASAEAHHLTEPDPLCEECAEAPAEFQGLCEGCLADRLEAAQDAAALEQGRDEHHAQLAQEARRG